MTPPGKKRPDPEREAQFLAEVKRDQAAREKTYREQALSIYPHVCGRCGREFSGKTLRELTVHHRDHDHMNNPSDGSNWELLCLYCHDDEHGAYEEKRPCAGSSSGGDQDASLEFRPFEGLGGLLDSGSDESNSG